MRLGIIAVVAVIVGVAYFAGDDPALMKSVMHGFGWGVGREIAHEVVHHALR